MKILMIDDGEDLCFMVDQFLKKGGHEFVAAYSGKEGMAIVEQKLAQGEHFDAALVDVRLKGVMNGFDVCAAIKAISKQTKVIITSGFLDEQKLDFAKSAGADDILHKPFNSAQVYAVLGVTGD